MKNLLRVAAVALAITAVAEANAFDAKKFTQYELPNSTLHVYESGDPMGDVSFIVEGEKRLVIIEQPTFYSAIEEFGEYVETLKKPIEKVVVNYHSGGAAQYAKKLLIQPATMAKFELSPNYQGMISKFTKAFGEAADFRAVKGMKGFQLPTTMTLAGVELDFTTGATNDMPAATIQIDNDAIYTHFAPAKKHANPMQIKSLESIDAMLQELTKIQKSGAKYIFGSHGAPSTQQEVTFQIDYLNHIKALRSECSSADMFQQRLLLYAPNIPNVESLGKIAKALYPNERVDPAKEEVRARMQDYFDVVSNLDFKLARELWAEQGDVSIVAPRGHFFGVESISNDFLKRAFSSFQYRKLSSLSEVINIYGNSANVQLYWKFDTKDADGVESSNRGRETLIFEKMNGVWRLVHVHYSHMPH